MRFLVSMVSMGAALTLIAASGLMNWVFMTSLGRSEFQQHILGAVASRFPSSSPSFRRSCCGLGARGAWFSSFWVCRSF
jgi:hypothetical protein